MASFNRLITVARRFAPRYGAQRTSRYTSTYTTEYNGGGSGDDNGDVPTEPSIRKTVFISQSANVFTNLALEDWLYRNYDFTNRHVLLLWRNDPCVVFGRHQNPWTECNVQAAERRGLVLVRRNSAGGTVYQDNGTLNLSFFTPRVRHSRRYNLEIISRALFREWFMKSAIDERDDIIVQGDYKISQTASKLGQPNTYHHCTLSVGADRNNLNSIFAFERKEDDVITNATSERPLMNLIDINPNVTMNKLITAIGNEYLRTTPFIVQDGKHKLLEQQLGFQFINPTEDWFSGIDELADNFRSWNWNFGRTPKFTVTRTLEILGQDGEMRRLNVHLEIKDGIVDEVRISLPKELASTIIDQDASMFDLCGTKYDHKTTDNIIAAIGCNAEEVQTEDKSNVMATRLQ